LFVENTLRQAQEKLSLLQQKLQIAKSTAAKAATVPVASTAAEAQPEPYRPALQQRH
jgi:hypothetical protein